MKIGLLAIALAASLVVPGALIAQTADGVTLAAPEEGPADEAPAEPAPADAGAGAASATAASQPESPEAAKKVAAQQERCDPNVDVCLVAEVQGREKGHMWGRGFADLRFGELRIQSDSLDIFEVEEQGVTTQRLMAEGNVVLLRKQERLAGKKLSLNLDTGRGLMDDVVGYVEPGVFFTAKEVERLDPKTYHIKSGRFSSCCQPNPHWSFAAHRATMKVGSRIQAAAVHFDLAIPGVGGQTPAVFLPYFVYPLKENNRATGLLFPSFNIDFARGVDIRTGFFLAMGRSADQTVSYEYRPRMAPRLAHELRWALGGPSAGTMRTYLFPPSHAAPIDGLAPPNESWDYDLDWSARQMLPARFQATLSASISSPQNYLIGFDRYYNTSRRFAFSVQRTVARQLFQFQVKSDEDVFDQSSTAKRSLPRVSLSQVPRAIGHTGVRWEYAAQYGQLQIARKFSATERVSDTWGRFDVAPAVSRPLALPFLSVLPRLAVRYTHYDASCPSGRCRQDHLNYDGPAIARQYVEGSVEVAGPQFSRIFSGPRGFSDRIKHVIGPKLTWVYRRATENEKEIPRFDGIDKLARAHELNYGVTQSLYGRRKSRAGDMQPFEFLSWSIFQKYYFQPPLIASDPSFNTLLFNEADGTGTNIHRSPIRSEFSLKPVPQWSFDWTQEYDPNRKKTTRLNLATDIRGLLGRLRASWSRSPALVRDDGVELRPEESAVRGDLELTVFGKWLGLGGSTIYSLVGREFLQRSVHARLDAQCIALVLDLRTQRYSPGAPLIRSFGFAIELANLGSIGMDPGRGGGLMSGSSGRR